jgi:hypothetical protein
MLIYLLRFLLRNPSIEEIFLQLIINGLKKFLVSLGNIGSPIIDYEIRINTNIRMKNDDYLQTRSVINRLSREYTIVKYSKAFYR